MAHCQGYNTTFLMKGGEEVQLVPSHQLVQYMPQVVILASPMPHLYTLIYRVIPCAMHIRSTVTVPLQVSAKSWYYVTNHFSAITNKFHA